MRIAIELSDPVTVEVQEELRRLEKLGDGWIGVAKALLELKKFIAERDAPNECQSVEENQVFLRDLSTSIIFMLDMLLHPSKQHVPEIILYQNIALSALVRGTNSRLFVTGSLIDKFGIDRTSNYFHKKVRIESTAIMRFMIETKIEPNESKAARQIAEALKLGNYSWGQEGKEIKDPSEKIRKWPKMLKKDETASAAVNERLGQMRLDAQSKAPDRMVELALKTLSITSSGGKLAG